MMLRKGKWKYLLAAALIASLCSGMSAPAALAAEPSGPASDTEIAANYKKAPTGPGAEQPREEQSGQTGASGQEGGQPAEGQQSGQTDSSSGTLGTEQQPETGSADAGQQGQTAEEKQTDAGQEADISHEGMVASGGRWIDPSRPMIALTFDDGPYAPVGNRIMDVLEQYGGRSTFFVVGDRVATYKTEISRMQENGHEIANHTYEHKYLTKVGAAEIQRQIENCNAAVAAVTGVSPTLVRLPGGLKNSTVLANVHYPIIMWNVDTLDWKTRNARKTIDAVVGKVQDGDIVLMHELYSATGDAVDVIVPALTEQGFQLVTVSELASFRGGVAAGGVYSKMRP